MNQKINIQDFQQYFLDKGIFTTKNVLTFYRQIEKNIKKTTIYWRIHILIQKGIISRVGRGKYTIETSVNFTPSPTLKATKINALIKKNYPFINYCIWDTLVVKEFLQHQSFNSFLIIEVEKDSIDSIFQFLKEQYKTTFRKPSQQIIEDYLLDKKDVIIIKSLISEAPVQVIDKIPTTTIEKLLVDLYSEKNLFFAYQGMELKRIYRNAFAKYTINESKLLRYANRRSKGEIKDLIASFE